MGRAAHPFDLVSNTDVPTASARVSGTLASFSSSDVQGCAVVTVAGEIDLCTSPGLHDALADAALRSDRVIVDLSRVSFLDSTGMAVMVKALREDHERSHESLCLVGPVGLVLRALEVTGLDKLFLICPSVEVAAAELTRG